MSYENQNYQTAPPPPMPDKASGMAITALVLGILGFCCCGIFAGIPALIVGFLENGKINRGESSPKGKAFAVAGIILGVISLILGCLQIIWVAFFGGLNVLQGLANQ
jgi:hypothetical protein